MHDVSVWDKVGHRIVATLIASGFVGGTFGSRGDRNFGASNSVALRIVDRANNAAVNSLRGCRGCAEAERLEIKLRASREQSDFSFNPS